MAKRLILEHYRDQQTRWENRAQQLRELAAGMQDEIARALMVGLFTRYEQLAVRAEELGWKARDGEGESVEMWDGEGPATTVSGPPGHVPGRPRMVSVTPTGRR